MTRNLLRRHWRPACYFSAESDSELPFLQQVQAYFDKAAAHLDIPADKLKYACSDNFSYYKKTDCVIKFHIPLGTEFGVMCSA